MVIVDMAEPLVPCFQASFRKLHNLLAKAAPEAELAVSTDPVLGAFVADVFFAFDFVLVPQVRLVLLSSIEDAGALTDGAFLGEFVAAPGLNLIVLRILMALPVVLAAKLLRAAGKGAAIRTGVAFKVLSVTSVRHGEIPIRSSKGGLLHIALPSHCR